MLAELVVRDYALIDKLTIEFGPGLNVLTGETGAGKSIIVGALTLLLGGRADSDSIRTGADAALVEGRFELDKPGAARCAEAGIDCPDGTLILRRRADKAGRGAAHANDSPTTVGGLERLGDRLVDLHGQHSHQLLLRPETHLELLDAYARLWDRREALAALFAEYSGLRERLVALERSLAERRSRRELADFHLQELTTAAVRPGEPAELEEERRLLQTAEKRYALAQALDAVLSDQDPSVSQLLGRAARTLDELAELDSEFATRQTGLATARAEVDDLWRAVVAYRDGIALSPERVEAVNSRLFLLDKLARKHGVAPDDLPGLAERLRADADSLESDEAGLAELRAELTEKQERLVAASVDLSSRRSRVRSALEKKLVAEFAQLGLEKARLAVALERTADPEGDCVVDGDRLRLGPTGIDTAEFLFSANPGEELRPLRKVASGGEMSRVMLALKGVLAEADPVPTLVFDEIDSGIGGTVADAVGVRLARLARTHQVICITHLPQIACYAAAHYRVEKHVRAGRTVPSVARLDDDERTDELARMTAGAKVGKAGIAHARELLDAAKKALRD
ncbi:MAG: DNA repair protein RecN [bacterium]